MTNKARRLLIRFGKSIPFVLCFIVLVSYVENAYSLYIGNLLQYGDDVAICTPFSFMLAKVFEYDWMTIIATAILTIAIETCYWNKLALLYLLIQLWEKDYFSSIELYPEYIYLICIINIAVCGFFCYKGTKILLR